MERRREPLTRETGLTKVSGRTVGTVPLRQRRREQDRKTKGRRTHEEYFSTEDHSDEVRRGRRVSSTWGRGSGSVCTINVLPIN